MRCRGQCKGSGKNSWGGRPRPPTSFPPFGKGGLGGISGGPGLSPVLHPLGWGGPPCPPDAGSGFRVSDVGFWNLRVHHLSGAISCRCFHQFPFVLLRLRWGRLSPVLGAGVPSCERAILTATSAKHQFVILSGAKDLGFSRNYEILRQLCCLRMTNILVAKSDFRLPTSKSP